MISPAGSAELDGLKRIDVSPPEWTLTGRQQLQLVVTGYFADGRICDLTDRAEFSCPTSAVRLNGSTVTMSAGQAGNRQRHRVTASIGSFQASCRLLLTSAGEPVSFSRQVLPLLSKHGCSSGACHGSPQGKGGFRLSLRAFQPTLDATTLTREFESRRINRFQPGESLLLKKPNMEVAHGGGKRLKPSDRAYTLWRDWIAGGCPIDHTDNAHCLSLEVFPRHGRSLRKPFASQQMRVVAHLADGSRRDVTSLCVFSSSDEAVVTVSDSGRVQSQRRGEAAIVVRYLQHIETAMFTTAIDVADFVWTALPVHNYIDRLVDDKLRRLQIKPAPLCGDSQFIRRVYLDVLGILPSADEVRRFLGDRRVDKRRQLVDQLLEHPQHARFWTLKWGDLLRMSQRQIGRRGLPRYYDWVHDAVRKNIPYNQFVADLLTSSGSTWTNPAANYYRTEASTDDVVETTAQTFLGMRIQCAKCHNHPFERWTQSDYYGLSAFFHRVQRKRIKPKKGKKGEVEVVIGVAKNGDVRHPQNGKVLRPWAPSAGSFEMDQSADRRAAFARWLTGQDNPFLAKVEVNRIWSYLLGRGIVEPFDDFRESNPAANDELLTALARDFAAHHFDRQYILRRILNSRTYQSTSQRLAHGKDRESPERLHEIRLSEKYFASYPARMLSAEQLLDAIGFVTGLPEKLAGHSPDALATGMMAPDLANHEFLRTFGQPQRQSACQCERGKESSLPRALALYNGKLVQSKLANRKNRFQRALAADSRLADIIQDLYLSALSRSANKREMAVGIRYVSSAKDRSAALEDLCWAILNKSEFLFQH